MRDARVMTTILAGTAGMAATTLIAGAMLTVTPQQAVATPAIAQKEKAPCTKCHTAPPALNDYGTKYKAGMKK